MVTTKAKNKLMKELKIYISQVIAETLKDPDLGLELKGSFKNKLKKILKGKVKFYSDDEVRKRLGL
mgnify:CR=1 FL=1